MVGVSYTNFATCQKKTLPFITIISDYHKHRAPGLKFAFTGQNIAITFGPQTTNRVLIAYRVAGLDWQLSNITTNATHHLVSSSTPGLNATQPSQLPLVFELRVTNWGYGVQIGAVHLGKGAKLIKVPDFDRRIEFIGDSLTSGYSATYEAFSGFGCKLGSVLVLLLWCCTDGCHFCLKPHLECQLTRKLTAFALLSTNSSPP
jgi:hypothetical protein